MRARGRRDTTQQLVREMHETLRKLVESNNAMGGHLLVVNEQIGALTESTKDANTHLHALTGQLGALGGTLVELENTQDDLDGRVTRLEKKGGRK